MYFTEIKRKETCLYPIFDKHYGREEVCDECIENKYNAIFFSNWYSMHDVSKEEYDIFQQVGNECTRSKEVNKFLDRLVQIEKMKVDGNLDEEMYNILLENYLNKINN